MKARIYIETSRESSNECNFIKQYISYLLQTAYENCGIEILCVGGKDNLCKFDNQMRECTMFGGRNLVIFDCDSTTSGGGVIKRSEELKRLKDAMNLDFSFFLFPNNKDEGAFEDLLLQIINPMHKGIVECFDQYEKCVGGQNEVLGGVYETPNSKAKIYTYIASFRRSRSKTERMKQGNWEFQNKNYWDLESEYLNPLKHFLLRNIK